MSKTTFHEDEARAFLDAQGWPGALQDRLIRQAHKTAIRYFLCDNSASMAAGDSKRILTDGRIYKQVSCSRWAELAACMKFHAHLAHVSGAVGEFRLINGAEPPRVVGGDRAVSETNLWALLRQLNEQYPHGTSAKFAQHVEEVTESIRALAPELQASGRQAVVVIATDMSKMDAKLGAAILKLKELPVTVVFRLCHQYDKRTCPQETLEKWVAEELAMDSPRVGTTIDEASDVHDNNPWFVHAEPMNRLRELGLPTADLRELKRHKWTLDEIHAFVANMFAAADPTEVPHPEFDFAEFKKYIQRKMIDQTAVYSPVRGTMCDWIDAEKILAPSTTQGASVPRPFGSSFFLPPEARPATNYLT